MIEELLKESQTLKEALKVVLVRNAQLEERLKLNSKNISKPLSSDYKKNTHNLPKNRGGGQKGLLPHLRKQFEEHEIRKTQLCSTHICSRCGGTHITSTHAISYLDQVELENRKVSFTRYHRPFYHYCLAHILRDFQRIVERNGDEGEIGLELIFHLSEVFRLSKDSLIKKKRRQIHYRRRYNRSERDLRPLVLWRKKSFGTQSFLGQGFVKRIASVCGFDKWYKPLFFFVLIGDSGRVFFQTLSFWKKESDD